MWDKSDSLVHWPLAAPCVPGEVCSSPVPFLCLYLQSQLSGNLEENQTNYEVQGKVLAGY